MQGSVLLVTDVLLLGGIEGEVADGSDQRIDAEGNDTQKQVSTGSAGVAGGLQGGTKCQEKRREKNE